MALPYQRTGDLQKAVQQIITGLNATTGAANVGTNDGTVQSDITALQAFSTSAQAAWNLYTPTITAASGAFTSVSATGFYLQVGKTVFFSIRINIVTNGTAAGSVNATLPITVGAQKCIFAGRADTLSGKMCQGIGQANTTTLNICDYANAYPGSSGESISMSGVYQSA